MANPSEDVDDIRRKMAQVRMTLHHDMRGVVAGAEAVTDWRSYIGRYPWVYLGVALGAGFLLVPARRASIHATVQAAADAAAEKVKETVATENQILPSPSTARGKGLFSLAIAFIAPMALRAAQGYAIQYLENVLTPKGATYPTYSSQPVDKSS